MTTGPSWAHDPCDRTLAVQQQPQAAPKRCEVNGKLIRLWWPQMIIWSAAAAFAGAALVAGIYFLVLQVDWHVHIGPVRFQIFDLKQWWDGSGAWASRGGMGFVKSAAWPDYRHLAFRDLAEPAIATMAVKTLLAKSKWWNTRVASWRLAATPLILLALTFALGLGATWILDFGLPEAGRHLFHAPAATWEVVIAGIIIGQVLHRIWAPAGATFQGSIVDRLVARARQAGGAIPVWVRWPLTPPVIRERFCWDMAHHAAVPVTTKAHRALTRVIGAVAVLLVIAGVIAHYWVGMGHSFPYLAP
jgi:hypothetical protein